MAGTNNKRKPAMKKAVFAVAAGVVAAGAVAAAAASLGGITGATLGAEDVVVAACDSDGITVGYTTAYSATGGLYNVTAVNLSGVDAACNSKAYSLTLADNTNASLVTTTGTLTVAFNAATITVTPVSAKPVEKLALVISG